MRIFTKLKTMKLKVLILAAIVFGVYMFISSILLHVWFITDKELTNPIVLPYVVVHLDLKGTPLKLSYLESLLPKMREFGANSLLMEYEDMFPYEGRLENLSAESCYTKNELIKFLTVAKKSGFEIIPLVQTFGHMEHVLKLDEFRDLREDHRHPDSICPSRQESNALVMEMLEQVIQLHTAVAPLKHIHIGCDEVYHLNKCQYCVQRNMTKLDIFVDHVRTVSGFVKSLSPDTTVLIWDDMLQDIKPHIWNKIGPLDVQPVYWEYAPKLRVTHFNLMQYHNKFRHIWIASAFKGADGRTSTFPILNNRFTNVFNWMKFIQDYKFGGESKVYNFQGMILTGWSRYTHMDPPCELLPVAYPSLIMTLLLIQTFKNGEISSSWKSKHSDPFQAFKEKYLVNLSMDCTTHSNVYNENGCKFDGQVLYTTIALIQHRELLKHYDANSNKFENFEYYSKLGLINTNQVLNNIASISLRLESLLRTEKLIIRQMNKYYKRDFIAEYVHYKTYYLKNKLQSALNALLSYSEKQSWSRRSKNISFYI